LRRVTRGPRQLAGADQRLERSRHFENGDATAGVVIGARPLMIQVTGECNFLIFQPRVRSGYDGGNHFVECRVLAGHHHRMQTNRLLGVEPLLHPAGGLERHHEGKGLVRRKGLQMPPAN
jgi:hypothetical protein